MHSTSGSDRLLMKGATALVRDRGELLVAANGRVHVLDAQGAKRKRYPAGAGITTMARVGKWLVAGFQNGGLELVPLRRGERKPTFSFEGTPASPVVRIVPGPVGTLIAGFGNGFYGLWSLNNGTLLEHGRLHGPVVHLLPQGRKLYAASELGQYEVMDLGVFHVPYCDLLRQVWTKVPVVWPAGLPVRRPVPAGHRCARR
jgi:hypothetical protein